MLKIGVLGVGHLGKIHLKCIKLADQEYELVGFFDPDDNNAKTAIDQHQVKRFDTIEALLEAVDVVDIVAPTTLHHKLASQVIKASKHVFIEKPITQTPQEAEDLMALSDEYGVKVQVGHVERFNPALLALEDMIVNPMFVEAHRLSIFNPRGTDVSVVLDLMIHDLDILLSMVRSKPVNVHASGVSIVSTTPDIANARIEFENGCVANLTASRISLKQMRKVRLFQPDAYISLDFLDKKAQVVRLFDKGGEHVPDGDLMELPTAKGDKLIHISMPGIQPVNAIKMELETFAESIRTNSLPRVSIQDGYNALKLAHDIDRQISQKEKNN
ncbi:MAG: Gfo/Idh/MocA family oxidoreductase [Bacteroidota bacterium]